METKKTAIKYQVRLIDEKNFMNFMEFEDKLMAVELALQLSKFPNLLSVSVVSSENENIVNL